MSQRKLIAAKAGVIVLGFAALIGGTVCGFYALVHIGSKEWLEFKYLGGLVVCSMIVEGMLVILRNRFRGLNLIEALKGNR